MVLAQLFIQHDFVQTHNTATSVDYRLVAFTDTDQGDRLYYILEMVPAQRPDHNHKVSRHGTYVVNPIGDTRLIIEIPHPEFEAHTVAEGIEAFLRLDSKVLAIAGTHRRNSSDQSPCDGSSSKDYRKSDAVHATQHVFYRAHKALENSLGTPIFLQFHGFTLSSPRRMILVLTAYETGNAFTKQISNLPD